MGLIPRKGIFKLSFQSLFLRLAVASSLLMRAYAAEPAYTVVDLGTLGGTQATAIRINDSGLVVGNSLLNSNVAEHPFLWSGGRMVDLGTLGGTVGHAFGVNGLGQVVGTSHTVGNAAFHAFLFSGGTMHDLGTLPGSTDSVGASINDSGQVAGWSYTDGLGASHAVLFNGGAITDLGTLGGTSSFGEGINASGQVAGSSNIAGDAAEHAFLYSGGVMQDLGTLGGTSSEAFGINDLGQVVGSSDIAGNAARHAFLYSGGVMHDLGALSGSNASSAIGINNSGQIVGLSSFSDQTTRAFLDSGGVMRNLTDLIPANTLPPGALLTEALGINSSGQIIANSANTFHAYLLTPAPPLTISSPASLPPGTVGVPYGPVPFTASGGTAERDWAATGLPAGLFINAATGALGGTPELGSEGVYPNAKFTVIDSNGAVASVTLSLTMNPSGPVVPPPPVITSVSPNPVLGITSNQSFCVNGSGFINGPGLKVRLTWPAAQVDLPVGFFNPNQLCLSFNFGIAPGNWTAQVVSGDGQLSNIFFFTVAAPGHGMITHLALPHFVFGGSWYSAIYLSNTTNALESVQVKFTDDNGAPLLVPLAGIGSVSSRIVILNPGTTVLLEALNGPGPFAEGWADISLPPGVIGYGTSREVIAGRADREALVPFVPESSQTAEFAFDDTSFTTAVALLNPSSQQITVTVTAFGADGDQVGSAQLALAPHAKSVNILSAYAGMAGVSGKQGRVVVSVPNGAVSVLGLRFGPSGFSDIPVNHR